MICKKLEDGKLAMLLDPKEQEVLAHMLAYTSLVHPTDYTLLRDAYLRHEHSIQLSLNDARKPRFLAFLTAIEQALRNSENIQFTIIQE